MLQATGRPWPGPSRETSIFAGVGPSWRSWATSWAIKPSRIEKHDNILRVIERKLANITNNALTSEPKHIGRPLETRPRCDQSGRGPRGRCYCPPRGWRLSCPWGSQTRSNLRKVHLCSRPGFFQFTPDICLIILLINVILVKCSAINKLWSLYFDGVLGFLVSYR